MGILIVALRRDAHDLKHFLGPGLTVRLAVAVELNHLRDLLAYPLYRV